MLMNFELGILDALQTLHTPIGDLAFCFITKQAYREEDAAFFQSVMYRLYFRMDICGRALRNCRNYQKTISADIIQSWPDVRTV